MSVYLPESCYSCQFKKYENTLEAIFMGAILPVIVINLVLYILIAIRLRNRVTKSTNTRDNTLSRAFLLLSVSWMILWSPLIVFRILFGFLDVPDPKELFELWGSDYRLHERYYLAEFVVVQTSLLFSSINSVILIVVLRPFHEPLLMTARKIKKGCCWNVERWKDNIENFMHFFGEKLPVSNH